MTKRKTPDERIAELEQQEAQIKARIQRAKTQQRAEKRKLDNRQKIIIGGMVKAHMQADSEFKALVEKLLDEQVTRPADRKTLGLAPLDSEGVNDGKTTAKGSFRSKSGDGGG